ncbi:MAG: ribosome silencing factor [Acidobacteria bacterium]|nr:ribosome silencing factor [Acidobacteriota bacterium]
MRSKWNEPGSPLGEAVEAALDKKALEITVLDMKEAASFTDYFLICSGTSSRQTQAISDEIERRLSLSGLHPLHVEGYNHAEWILMDYVNFVVHIFSEQARIFYGLERLWRTARRVPVSAEL